MIDDQGSGVSMCQLSLPGFEGSVDAFLALVAQHKVAADEVPVADVTRQFLSHMTEMQHLNLQLAGELMAASARLMLMKSSQLLVQPESDQDADSLLEMVFDSTERSRFLEAIDSLSNREGEESFVPFTTPIEIERRPAPRSPSLLVRAWSDMSGRSATPEQRVAVSSFVRLEVAVSGLIRTLRTRSKLVFRHLVGKSNRNDTVVHFMAMLELIRQRRLRAEQEDLFTDITMHWITDNAESSSRLG
jgi:segregation and condensation protein A